MSCNILATCYNNNMTKIHKLSDKVINQIAAGEVVERPASIIKELIENSLDASASQIEIKVKDGGISLIQISDNGIGIAPEDIPLAVKRYTTSKLETLQDLNNINSFGFRGEALASIAAVSILTIKSRIAKNKEAYELTVEFGEPKKLIPSARSIGTTITIKDLFGNVPARKKFLKTPNTEYRYILEMVQNFAITNPKVRFTFYKNDKLIYDLTPTTQNGYITRVSQIFKIDKDDLIPINHQEYGITIKGVAVNPKLLSKTSRFLKIFVNKRYIVDKSLYSAIKRGVSDYIPNDYKPTAIIDITIDPSQVDVNVHPRKLEVKFLNPFRINSAVSHAVKLAYSNYTDKLFTPNENLNTYINYENIIRHEHKNTSNLTLRSPSTKKVLENWDKNLENAVNRLRPNATEYQENTNFELNFNDPIRDTNYKDNTLTTSIKDFADNQTMLNIYQLLKRYILVEWETEIWIIDQHAAAERIRFEKLLDTYSSSKKETQSIVLGNKIYLSKDEIQVVRDKKDILTNLGFIFNLHDDYMEITGIPVFISSTDIESMIRDTLANLAKLEDTVPSDIKFATDNKFSHMIATIACHNSIRANEKLSITELKAILNALLKCDVPYACPHGRRLIWRLTKEDIDRQFMRPV